MEDSMFVISRLSSTEMWNSVTYFQGYWDTFQ